MKKKLGINKEWFGNKNVKPKTFVCHMEYSPGGFRISKAYVENKVNQHTSDFERVNCRALHKAMVDGDLVVN
jgi:hypothetical protein